MEGIESTLPCYFLRVPKEIRFQIYRELLFPMKMISMTPTEPNEEDEETDEEETDWVDEDEEDSDYPDTEEELADMMTSADDVVVTQWLTAEEANPISDEELEACKRHPAILRTNRQIYSEASSLMYSEAVLIVEPGDIFALRKRPKDLPFGERNEDVWRHNPLHGTGRQEGNKVVYDCRLMTGLMEPHIFARFQKIFFDANFDIGHTQHIELWIDDDTHVIRRNDALHFMRVVRHSPVIKDFVKLLRNSRQITKLEICLEVEVMADSTMMQQDIPYDDDDEDDEAGHEFDFKMDRLMDIASEKATELFLASKICEPLLKLSNVKIFDFKFGFDDREEHERYEPPAKYTDLLRLLKERVESNFKEPES